MNTRIAHAVASSDPDGAGGAVKLFRLRRAADGLKPKVIDKTEFNGRFDFDLEFSSDPLKTDATVPPLITVMQEGLGLRVESGNGPVEIFVIDQIEHPAEN